MTFDWWSDLWLNEGFATWVGWLAADHLFPDWKIWSQFVDDDYKRGLNLDSLRSSHPIEVPVKNPVGLGLPESSRIQAEINQIFDAISYSKGACAIRMLVSYLTEAKFQQGIRDYLKKFKYRNAKTQDLWDALAAASGKPVGKVMHAWTRQLGVRKAHSHLPESIRLFRLQKFLAKTATLLSKFVKNVFSRRAM